MFLDTYGSYYGPAVDFRAIFLAFIAVYLVTIAVSLVIGYVLMGFALMSFFRKVGVDPWVAWVPYYRYWKWLEVGGQPGWLSLLSLVGGGIVTTIFLGIGMYRSGFAFRKDTGFVVLGIFFPYVWLFIMGSHNSIYEPQLIAAAGYPPPLAGYGSVGYGQTASPAPPSA